MILEEAGFLVFLLNLNILYAVLYGYRLTQQLQGSVSYQLKPDGSPEMVGRSVEKLSVP